MSDHELSGEMSTVKAHETWMLDSHLALQRTAVWLACPLAVAFLLYRLVTDPCWQNLSHVLGFTVTTTGLLYGLRLTKQGRIDSSVLVLGNSMFFFNTITFAAFQGLDSAALLADLIVVIYASLLHKRFIYYGTGVTFVTFAYGQFVKYFKLYELKTLDAFDQFLFLLFFNGILLAVLALIMRRSNILQSSLIRLMDSMNKSQQNVISTASDTGEVLEDSVEQIKETSNAFAQKAREQASAIKDINLVMSHIRRLAGQTASTATSTVSLSGSVREKTVTGSNQLKAMQEGFNEIVEINEVAQEEFADLASQAESIEEVLRTNRDIAAQIKILAINAGIQAAKAGEYGSGFRVVASELKSMIVRTEESLSHSRGLLEDIRTRARKSSDTIRKSSDLLHRQSEELVSSKKLIEDISNAFVNTSDQFLQITHAAKEQQVKLDEVGSGINHIDFTAEELNTSADALLVSINKIAQSHEELITVLSSPL